METEKKIIGRCPLCGGSVVKTCKGYRCEHNIGDNPSCVLNINGIIGNRKMGDGEVAELLEKRRILLDGFATKEGKTFPTVLELADDGAVNMRPVIGKCPTAAETSVWEAGRSTAPTTAIKRNLALLPSGVTSAATRSRLPRLRISARRASPPPNWKCTGMTAPSTANGWGLRLTNFKS